MGRFVHRTTFTKISGESLNPLKPFFLRYVLNYWRWYLFGVVFLVTTNWLAVQIPLQLAKAIDALGHHNKMDALKAIQTIALMGVAVILVRTLSRILFFTPGRLIEYKIKNQLFDHLLSLQPDFYARWQHGDIVSRISNDMTFVRVLAGFGMLQLVNVSTALFLAGYAMMTLSVSLTLWLFLPIVAAMIVVQHAIQRLFTLTKQNQEELSALSEHILSTLQGIHTIQGLRAEQAFFTRFLEKNRQYTKTNLHLAKIRSWFLPLLGLAGAFSIWLLFLRSGAMIQSKVFTVGQLIAMIAYVTYLIVPLRSLGWLLSVFQRGQTSLERVFALLKEKSVQTEHTDMSDQKRRISQTSPQVSCTKLSFSYPDAPDHPVLQDITFSIEAGKMVGIFGRTGAGKSTLLRLIARLYNPEKGQLWIDGCDIRFLDLEAWREEIAYAPQSAFLFSETIEENITFGKKEPKRLQEAIERAALQKDLDALPQGLQTIVGERGIMLSGGQRQRTALARAFYKKAPLLLLDDVLSAVDHATEQELLQNLRETQQQKPPTIFLISHRISALALADWILVLEKGRIIAQGTHSELQHQQGLYRDAWLQHERQNSPVALSEEQPSTSDVVREHSSNSMEN